MLPGTVGANSMQNHSSKRHGSLQQRLFACFLLSHLVCRLALARGARGNHRTSLPLPAATLPARAGPGGGHPAALPARRAEGRGGCAGGGGGGCGPGPKVWGAEKGGQECVRPHLLWRCAAARGILPDLLCQVGAAAGKQAVLARHGLHELLCGLAGWVLRTQLQQVRAMRACACSGQAAGRQAGREGRSPEV